MAWLVRVDAADGSQSDHLEENLTNGPIDVEEVGKNASIGIGQVDVEGKDVFCLGHRATNQQKSIGRKSMMLIAVAN